MKKNIIFPVSNKLFLTFYMFPNNHINESLVEILFNKGWGISSSNRLCQVATGEYTPLTCLWKLCRKLLFNVYADVRSSNYCNCNSFKVQLKFLFKNKIIFVCFLCVFICFLSMKKTFFSCFKQIVLNVFYVFFHPYLKHMDHIKKSCLSYGYSLYPLVKQFLSI